MTNTDPILDGLRLIRDRLSDPDRVVKDSGSLYETADGYHTGPFDEVHIEAQHGRAEPPRACFMGWTFYADAALGFSTDGYGDLHNLVADELHRRDVGMGLFTVALVAGTAVPFLSSLIAEREAKLEAAS